MSSHKMLMLDLFRSRCISANALRESRGAVGEPQLILSPSRQLLSCKPASVLSLIHTALKPSTSEVIPFFPSSPFPLDAPALKLKD